MSSFPLWLLSILRYLRVKFSRNVHGILGFFSWLYRRSRCAHGFLKSQKDQSGTQDSPAPKGPTSPSLEHIVLDRPEPDVFVSASAVPRSAHLVSVLNLIAIPDSPSVLLQRILVSTPAQYQLLINSLIPWPVLSPCSTRHSI